MDRGTVTIVSKWLRFTELVSDGKRITAVVAVETLNGVPLGHVKWHGAWRCYIFHPHMACIFEPTCLRDIADFCERATTEHKKRWKQISP